MACQQVSIEAHVWGTPFHFVINVKQQLYPGPPALTSLLILPSEAFYKGHKRQSWTMTHPPVNLGWTIRAP